MGLVIGLSIGGFLVLIAILLGSLILLRWAWQGRGPFRQFVKAGDAEKSSKSLVAMGSTYDVVNAASTGPVRVSLPASASPLGGAGATQVDNPIVVVAEDPEERARRVTKLGFTPERASGRL
jgi:hypothetical protein